MIKNIFTMLLFGLLVVAGCTQVPIDNGTDQNFQERELTFETVDKDFYSSLEAKNQLVIQNTKEFQEFWNKVGSLKLLDEIDFSKYTVITVSQGQKTSGGYSIEITKIIEKKDSIVVYFKETEAGSGQAIAAITSPYHIVKTKKLDKSVEFKFDSDKPPLPPVDDLQDYKEVQLNKEFSLKVGESAILKEDDLRIKFLEVTSYGLCPSDVQCIRFGSVFIKINAKYDNEKNLATYALRYGDAFEGGETSIDLIPPSYRNELTSPKAHNIKFMRIETTRDIKTGEVFDQSEYTAVFKITLAMTQ